MGYQIEPPLRHKPPELVRQNFFDIFGRGHAVAFGGDAIVCASDADADQAEGEREAALANPSRCYRRAVVAGLEFKYGTPMPPSLYALIDEAGYVGVHPDDVVDFIGWQFKLTPMRRYREPLSP